MCRHEGLLSFIRLFTFISRHEHDPFNLKVGGWGYTLHPKAFVRNTGAVEFKRCENQMRRHYRCELFGESEVGVFLLGLDTKSPNISVSLFNASRAKSPEHLGWSGTTSRADVEDHRLRRCQEACGSEKQKSSLSWSSLYKKLRRSFLVLYLKWQSWIPYRARTAHLVTSYQTYQCNCNLEIYIYICTTKRATEEDKKRGCLCKCLKILYIKTTRFVFKCNIIPQFGGFMFLSCGPAVY